MRVPVLRLAAFCVAVVCAPPPTAGADWLFTPYLGGTFGGETTFIGDLESGASSTQFIFGGSAGWLSRDAVIGLEADFAYAPRFFERDNRGGLVVGSNMTTLMGNVIAAAPLSLTRESLRPYLVGGVGMMHAGIQDFGGFFVVDENLLGMNVGGGAIGFITDDAGLRFDIRQFRALRGSEETLSGARRNRLSFWRATVGVTLRY